MGIKFHAEVVKNTKNVVQNVDFKPFPSFTILILMCLCAYCVQVTVLAHRHTFILPF